MLDFFKQLFGFKDSSSATAKERLRLVLLSDHISLAPEVVEALKADLLAVIARYVEIDPAHADVTFEQREREVAMLASIPIVGLKDERGAQRTAPLNGSGRHASTPVPPSWTRTAAEAAASDMTAAEPAAPVAAAPEAPVVALPEAPVAAAPEAPVVALPEAPVAAAPEAPVVALPEAPVTAAPEAPLVGTPEPPRAGEAPSGQAAPVTVAGGPHPAARGVPNLNGAATGLAADAPSKTGRAPSARPVEASVTNRAPGAVANAEADAGQGVETKGSPAASSVAHMPKRSANGSPPRRRRRRKSGSAKGKGAAGAPGGANATG